MALRLRAKGQQWLQTVKCAGSRAGGLSSRPEWETPYAGHFDFSVIDDPAVRDWLARPLRYYVGLLWHVAVPWSIRRHGYFAGRRYKAVGDMPAGVALQWRRWSLHPDFVVSHSPQVRQAYAEVRTPMTVVMLTDDELATNEGVRRQHAHYTQAPQTHVRLRPQDHGVRRIGHFDFFRATCGKALWPLALAWLVDEPTQTGGGAAPR